MQHYLTKIASCEIWTITDFQMLQKIKIIYAFSRFFIKPQTFCNQIYIHCCVVKRVAFSVIYARVKFRCARIAVFPKP